METYLFYCGSRVFIGDWIVYKGISYRVTNIDSIGKIIHLNNSMMVGSYDFPNNLYFATRL